MAMDRHSTAPGPDSYPDGHAKQCAAAPWSTRPGLGLYWFAGHGAQTEPPVVPSTVPYVPAGKRYGRAAIVSCEQHTRRHSENEAVGRLTRAKLADVLDQVVLQGGESRLQLAPPGHPAFGLGDEVALERRGAKRAGDAEAVEVRVEARGNGQDVLEVVPCRHARGYEDTEAHSNSKHKIPAAQFTHDEPMAEAA